MPPPSQSADAGDEDGPLRRCAVSRMRQPKERLLRFVVSPDGVVLPDLAARLPGRGIWLSARGDVLETACARGAFARAARAPVTVPPDLAEQVRLGLVRRVTEFIGLARRAGQAVGGFTKARAWVQAGQAGLVIQARDGSGEERARLVGRTDLPVVAPLAAAALGAVFGRDHLVHVAVAPGRLAEMIHTEAERLAGVERPAGPVRAGVAGVDKARAKTTRAETKRGGGRRDSGQHDLGRADG